MNNKDYISTADLARILGVTRQAIQKRLKKENDLSTKEVGTSLMYLVGSLPQDLKDRIKEEQEIFKTTELKFENLTLNIAHPNRQQEMKKILEAIDTLPKPMVIHHWNTICPEAKFFIQQFEKQTQSKSINLNQTNVRTN